MDPVCRKNFVIANKKKDSVPQNSPTVQCDTNSPRLKHNLNMSNICNVRAARQTLTPFAQNIYPRLLIEF